jgi:hypothetical protein
MDSFCLGTFGNILKEVINEPRANVRAVELMLDLVLSNATIKNQSGDDFRVTDKTPVQRKIMQAASTRKATPRWRRYLSRATLCSRRHTQGKTIGLQSLTR